MKDKAKAEALFARVSKLITEIQQGKRNPQTRVIKEDGLIKVRRFK